MNPLSLCAGVTLSNLPKLWENLGGAGSVVFWLAISGGLIAVVVVGFTIRRKLKQERGDGHRWGHRSHRHRQGDGSSGRRRRRRRRGNVMNPTLAQTGGLPPIRRDPNEAGPDEPEQPNSAPSPGAPQRE